MSRSPNLRHLSRSQRFARAVLCVLASAAVASLSVLVGLSTSGSAQAAAPVGQGFNLNAGDLRFILTQIKIAEAHAAGGQLLGPGAFQVSSPLLPFGLRTVDGTFNNLQPGQSAFGAADTIFPRMLVPSYRQAEGGTAYTQKSGLVFDSQPRTNSNLIVEFIAPSLPIRVCITAPPIRQHTTSIFQVKISVALLPPSRKI